MKKDDIVLVKDASYRVHAISDAGVQLVTNTGFAGVPLSDIRKIK